MKLAIVGAVVVAGGLVAGVDGLVYVGGLWVAGGVVLRLVVGSPKELARPEAGARFSEAFGGRRGVGSLGVVAIGLASITLGLTGTGFEGNEVWRWLPVALGVLMAGMQVLALLLLSLGSGLQSLTGHVGDPDHRAVVTLHGVTETGVLINDRPKLALDLTVEPEGGPSYRTRVRQVVGHAEIGSVRPGQQYRALVDPHRRDAVTVRWHEPLPAPRPQPHPREDVAARLDRLDRLARDGVITAEEHAATRRDILDEL